MRAIVELSWQDVVCGLDQLLLPKSKAKLKYAADLSHTRGDGAVTSQIPLPVTALSLIGDSRMHLFR
jgi:hypothetical protein